MSQKGLSQKQWDVGLETNEHDKSKKREQEKKNREHLWDDGNLNKTRISLDDLLFIAVNNCLGSNA